MNAQILIQITNNVKYKNYEWKIFSRIDNRNLHINEFQIESSNPNNNLSPGKYHSNYSQLKKLTLNENQSC